jgi:hypothetical protein
MGGSYLDAYRGKFPCVKMSLFMEAKIELIEELLCFLYLQGFQV